MLFEIDRRKRVDDCLHSVEDISGEDLREAAAAVFRRGNATIGVLTAPAAQEEGE